MTRKELKLHYERGTIMIVPVKSKSKEIKGFWLSYIIECRKWLFFTWYVKIYAMGTDFTSRKGLALEYESFEDALSGMRWILRMRYKENQLLRFKSALSSRYLKNAPIIKTLPSEKIN